MLHPDEMDQTWIEILAEGIAAPANLTQAINDAGWHWREWTDVKTFMDAPKHARSVVVIVIETFTLASLDLIGMLASESDLAVVVYGMENHPVFVRAVLEAGAEDFLSPSATSAEIIARIHAVIRIRFRDADARNARSAYRLDDAGHTILLSDGTVIRLTLSEYHLFKALLAAGNQPVPRSRLIASLAPFSRSNSSNALEATIARLRRKVGGARLRTIRGFGYQLINGA